MAVNEEANGINKSYLIYLLEMEKEKKKKKKMAAQERIQESYCCFKKV